MIATKELELTVEDTQGLTNEYIAVANEYIANVLGQNYFTKKGNKREHGWNFAVQCHRDDMKFSPMVGYLTICHDGQVETLSENRIREMKEAAETQAAKARGEKFARDENGFVLRRQARTKAHVWLGDYVDFKIGAAGGIFIPVEPPIWRFSVCDFWIGGGEPILDVIDVNALTGEVYKPSEEQIEIIIRGASATRKHQEYTPTVR